MTRRKPVSRPPAGQQPRRLGYVEALSAAFLGSVVISFVLGWQGWIVIGMPPIAVLGYAIALMVWAPVRTAVGRLSLLIIAFVGMIVGLYAVPFLS
jgi:hypothetical protein